jgi:hypothetical protein
MQNLGFAAEGAWRVLVASLILGAGLPTLFGLGVRALAYGAGGEAEVHETGVTGPVPHRIGTVAAWILFALVLLGVALGITFIIVSGLGKALSFEHVVPTIVDK